MYNLGSGGNSSPEIRNCRFFNNHGFAAGGIYNLGSTGGNSSPDIFNCTFVENEATGAGGTGGAIYNNASNAGTSSPTVTNCIIWGNIGPYNSHVFRNVYGTPTISYSIVDVADCASLNSGEGSNVTCGAGMIFNNDPLFVDEAGGDLHLAFGSPAVNAGDNSVVDQAQDEDMDCEQRIEDTTVDIGAYEGAAGPLPVELTDFRAYFERGMVVLNWTTLSEENNDYFTVERSADGFHFEKIAVLEAYGTSSTAHSYKTLDRNPFAGLNYYRLLQTDFDGSSAYGEIQVVEVIKGKVIAFPNPVVDQLHLSFSEFNETEAVFSIYDVFGQLVYQGTLELQQNLNTIHLSEVGDFVPGTYILQVTSSENGMVSHKFQKIGD